MFQHLAEGLDEQVLDRAPSGRGFDLDATEEVRRLVTSLRCRKDGARVKVLDAASLQRRNVIVLELDTPNPMTGIVEGFRAALAGRALPTETVMISVVLTLALFVCATYVFRRLETTFADVI